MTYSRRLKRRGEYVTADIDVAIAFTVDRYNTETHRALLFPVAHPGQLGTNNRQKIGIMVEQDWEIISCILEIARIARNLVATFKSQPALANDIKNLLMHAWAEILTGIEHPAYQNAYPLFTALLDAADLSTCIKPMEWLMIHHDESSEQWKNLKKLFSVDKALGKWWVEQQENPHLQTIVATVRDTIQRLFALNCKLRTADAARIKQKGESYCKTYLEGIGRLERE